MRGQAIVELALVMPLLLFVVLGGIWIGLLLVDRMELQHAAQEGAVMGVTASASADPCTTALGAAETVLGRPAAYATCSIDGASTLSVELHDEIPPLVPMFGPVTVRVVERGIVP
jgi:Flp pilus assembly protein TadG